MALPTDAKARKDAPLARGCLDYFPDALEAVAGVYMTTVHHADAIVSHLRKRGKRDENGIRYTALIARHALAILEEELNPGCKAGAYLGPPAEQIRTAPPELSGRVLECFPHALCAVAELSRIGNEQHNPGQPMHWAKEKSTDEADALLRHLAERGEIDTDDQRHSAKVAWRALALLQREIDSEREAPAVSGESEPDRFGTVHKEPRIPLGTEVIVTGESASEVQYDRCRGVLLEDDKSDEEFGGSWPLRVRITSGFRRGEQWFPRDAVKPVK